MNHVVMFSGGISSWGAAKRVAEKHGNVSALFCDTKIEDEDLYRFLDDAEANLGIPIYRIQDGRTPFEVFKDVGYMGNSRIDPCSKILKRQLADAWLKERYSPDEVVVYVGIEWTEIHRFERLAERKKPWIYSAPLCDYPRLEKQQLIEMAQAEGLKVPRLYEYGFPHNNCGGFCIRSGQAQFKRLHDTFPERYAEFEEAEQDVFKSIGKAHPFLRKVIDGKLHYLSMREFRLQYLEGDKQCDLFDWGGCGCFVDQEPETKEIVKA